MSRAIAATATKFTKRAKVKAPQKGKGLRLSVAEARRTFAELLERVARGRESVVIERAGKIVGFLGTARDLAVVVEEDEDREDAAAAHALLAEIERTGEQPIPYEQVRRELGLDLDLGKRRPLLRLRHRK